MSALQTATLWAVFLWLFPEGIIWLQANIGIARFDIGVWKVVAACVFGVAGVTGWYCGGLFVTHGNGTPMPLDQTTRLVILGPYRVVRNPMATLGIVQGLAVGMYLGSWPVLCYAIAGAVAWHLLARPYEEADLERRYGDQYREYRDSVHNWMPTIRPFKRLVASDEPKSP